MKQARCLKSNTDLINLIESRLLALKSTDACRLFHGRGHCYPGYEFLTIDFLPPALQLVYYDLPDGERFIELEHQLLLWSKGFVEGKANSFIETVVVQYRYRKPVECKVIGKPLPTEHIVFENGMRFKVDLERNQNCGLFLDAGPARRWVMANAEGKSVLNLFAYTCSFSVAAAVGGASRVVNIDMSSTALNTGRLNHRLTMEASTTALSGTEIRFLPHNIFKSWGKIKKNGPFDLVICDPPSYQPGSFVAEKDYVKVVRRVSTLTKPGALFLAILNAPMLEFSAFRAILSELGDAWVEKESIPVAEEFEELNSEYGLKMMVYERRDTAF